MKDPHDQDIGALAQVAAQRVIGIVTAQHPATAVEVDDDRMRAANVLVVRGPQVPALRGGIPASGRHAGAEGDVAAQIETAPGLDANRWYKRGLAQRRRVPA